MNYSNINEAYNLSNYEDDNKDIYIIDLDEETDLNKNLNENEKNNDNNKVNSTKLLNTYKNLNNTLNLNIELIEDLENNKMLLFNFISSIYNKHIEGVAILNKDLYNEENDNAEFKECDEFMMNYIEKFNNLYSKWNKDIYIKKKKEIEKKIEEDQIQLNGLRKIFINTTNEIINNDKNNDKTIKNTCPICFENEINMVAIPCGHVCCNICIMKNGKYNNGKCLCCRNPLKDYIKLFIQL